MSTIIAAVGVGAGLALMIVALLLRVREREADLAKVLDLPYGEQDVITGEPTEEHMTLFQPGVDLAQAALERFSMTERVAAELVRARIPLRPGEFGLAAAGIGVFGGLITYILTAQAIVALMMAAILMYAAWRFVLAKGARRRKAFEMALPEALSLIASSLEAGHTFMHSVEMMVQEAEPPLNEEFERVIAETRLGDPLLEALERLAARLQIKDLDWVVQAIRIQQNVGGKLAELLMTLADFMRAREEIRREVRVLTAEGRTSGNVLAVLPIAVFMMIRTMNPSYLEPMLHGGGLIALGAAALSVAVGIGIIRRMAKIDI